MNDTKSPGRYATNLARLREELTAWAEQEPATAHSCPQWRHLNRFLTAYEESNNTGLAFTAMYVMREIILRFYEADPVWSTCDRRHQIVAAFNGTRWDYDTAFPEVMTLDQQQANTDTPLPDAEYVHRAEDGRVVFVSKVGGGTLGKAYEGLWEYLVCRSDGLVIAVGSDFNTGMPKCHHQAADAVLDFFPLPE